MEKRGAYKASCIIILIALVILIGFVFYFRTFKLLFSTQTIAENDNLQVNNVQEDTVLITENHFFPSEIKIKKGTTITWLNQDLTKHTIISISSDRELNSPELLPQQTYSHTFNTEGIFLYRCSLHESMKGKIIVE